MKHVVPPIASPCPSLQNALGIQQWPYLIRLRVLYLALITPQGVVHAPVTLEASERQGLNLRLAWATGLDSASETKAKETISTIIVIVPQWFPSCRRIPEKAASSNSTSQLPRAERENKVLHLDPMPHSADKKTTTSGYQGCVETLSQSQMGDRDFQAN